MPAKTAKAKAKSSVSPTKQRSASAAQKSPARRTAREATTSPAQTRSRSGGRAKGAKQVATASPPKARGRGNKKAAASQSAPSEAEEDEASVSEAESEESSEVAQTQILKSDKKIKKIVGAKKIPATQAAPKATRSKSRGKSKSPAKKEPEKKEAPQPKKRATRAAAKDADEEMEDDEEEKEDSPAKAAPKKKEVKIPAIGKRRRKGGSDAEDSTEEKKSSADFVPVKKRKVNGTKVETMRATRPKPAPKKPTVLKLGKWNPDIEVIQEDKERDSEVSEILQECCTRCNNRNVHRAAMTGNRALLDKCVNDRKSITSLNAHWGPEDHKTPMELLLRLGDMSLLESFLKPKISKADIKDLGYDHQRNALFTSRSANDPYLMNFIDSGRVSHMAYGAHVRAVEMTRGNRQGNNAFLDYADNSLNFLQDLSYGGASEAWLRDGLLAVREFQMLEKLMTTSAGVDLKQNYSGQIMTFIQLGQYELPIYVIKELVKHSHYGFNELHLNCLQKYKKDVKLPEFKYVSVAKKGSGGVTPLHFACINPDVSILQQVLAVNPDFNLQDGQMRRPIHYAAACEATGPLEYLIQKGANVLDVDNRKTNCLHLAIKAKRAANVKLILAQGDGKGEQLIKMRDRSGLNAMAMACEVSDLEIIQALIKFGVKVNQGVGKERMQPLGWAAAKGNYELCEWLLDNKARVQGGDKFKRTALIMAIRNGHLKVASLLLQRGSDWQQSDSSSNSPLHFAAAYGWPECIDLLIQAGADKNAENSWKVTPINIAMLKNHEGVVKKFLDMPDVDVNCKDEKGRTLLTMALLDISERTPTFAKYLLSRGADPNIEDVDGQISLHYLAVLDFRYLQKPWNEDQTLWDLKITKKKQAQLELADILLSHKASLDHADHEKRIPFTLALERDNIDLLQKLIDNVSLNQQAQLLHALAPKILDTRYQAILRQLMTNEEPTPETMNSLDDDGLTPFLAYINKFCSSYAALKGKMMVLMNAEAVVHGTQYKHYKVDLTKLFGADDGEAQQSHGGRGRGRMKMPAARRAFGGGFNNYGGQQAEPAVVQTSVSAEKLEKITQEKMQSELVGPFLECLTMLVTQGADPKATVQKLKKYRDLDEEQKKLLKVKEAQNANMQVQAATKEEKVKKRDEVLKELKQKGRGKNFKKNEANVAQKKTANPKENEYHEEFGKQNAFHLAVGLPEQQLTALLFRFGVDCDLPDQKQMTPFNLQSSRSQSADEAIARSQTDFVATLLAHHVKFDLPDHKGRTAFLNYYGSSRLAEAKSLLDLGANVNRMDGSGLFALKYALIRRDGESLRELAQHYKADVNLLDGKKRNCLHHAVNMSSATADATFETEQLLIELGVNINQRDHHNRTPLHYAFVKIGDWSNTSQSDPIETVSSMCGVRGLEVDVLDKWQRTPLHYASQRGASCCAMYLQKRGANKEAVDIYGNTPLAVALLSHHHNFCIIMIQNACDINKKVHKIDPARIEQMWKKEKKATEPENQEMDGDSDHQETDRKHRHVFDNHQQKADSDGYGSDDDEDSDDDGSNSDSQFEHNAFNNQNAFGIQVFGKQTAKKASAWGGAGFKQSTAAAARAPDPEPVAAPKEAFKEEPKSMFRIAISHGQQGLAYLMMDMGYNMMHAAQDALDEKKFQLVLTLLSKVADDRIVQQKTDKGQNLFHILSQNSIGCKLEHLRRIYDTLKRRGVNCLEQDSFQRTALHYAAMGRSQELVELLIGEGADASTIDIYQQSPLTLYMKGAAARNQIFFSTTGKFDRIFALLKQNGADVNQVYLESAFEPAYAKNQSQLTAGIQYDSDQYKTTISINTVRQLIKSGTPGDEATLLENLQGLLKQGAKLDVSDSDGRDCMAYAIMANSLQLVRFLIVNASVGRLRGDNQDRAGKSSAHFVVNPCKFGSYENVQILRALAEAEHSLNMTDAAGKKPIDYTRLQESGILLKELAKLINREDLIKDAQREKAFASKTKRAAWPKCQVDFEQDAEAFMKEATEKEAQKLENVDELKNKVPVDKTGKFEKSYSVFAEAKKPWDAYLTKVDLKNGIYGDFVFYKLQMLYDAIRDLYVVFTRWGRIGEDGMNQRTPFNNVDEAKKEFCSIFKSKTGNDFLDLDNFARVPKKYAISKVNYVTVAHQDYLAPFDFENCPKSKLGKHQRQLLEEVANITMYQKAITSLGIDNDVLPVSCINREVVDKAKKVLNELADAVQEDVEISKKGMQADLVQLLEVRTRIQDLSSRYYEIIPQTQYKNQIAPPLASAQLLKQEFDKVGKLGDIEYASRILLGALYRQTELHPVDYLHQALNVKIDYVSPESDEQAVIEEYIKNTADSQISFATHKVNIFKIEREGESQNLEKFKPLGNRRLLFHGSSLFNFVGILSQGLRIAPPEAPTTGYMFGKGVYFADMFSKSLAYSSSRISNTQESTLLLLCDVALGNMREINGAEYIEELPAGYHSVRGLGQRGPNYDRSLTLPDGAIIPNGAVQAYEVTDEVKRNFQPSPWGGAQQPSYALAHNEFVVYNTEQIKMQYLLQVVKKTKEELQQHK